MLLRLDHMVGDEALTIATQPQYTNAAGNTYAVEHLRYFLSDIVLHSADQQSLTLADTHYVDVEEGIGLEIPVGEEGEGSWTQLSFVFGLSPQHNTDGAFESNPEALMVWPELMGGGYHFMKFEGRFINDDNDNVGFALHAGALNGGEYHSPMSYDLVIESGSTEAVMLLPIIIDIDRFFEEPNELDLNDYYLTGIMNDPVAQLILHENCHDVFSVGSIEEVPQ